MSENYGQPAALTALEAKSEAQKLAFSAIAFEAAVSLLRLGILRAVSDAGREGAHASDIAEKLDLSEYGVKVLLDMGLSIIQAHFFALYYGILGMLTPPVAPSVIIAAGIAKT